MTGLGRLTGMVGGFAHDTRGAAGVEFAMWLMLMAIPIFTVVDAGFYIYQKMQVQNAVQAAAQNAFAVCKDATMWPATSKCGTGGATLKTALSQGAQSSSLGTLVALSPGSNGEAGSEAYFCANAAGALVQTGTAGKISTTGANTAPSTPPATCSGVVAGSTVPPGDYVTANVKFTYHPIFKGASIAALFPANMTASATARLN
jgi:Flp pilus assembly protein TadG